jgi:hypothetical protein
MPQVTGLDGRIGPVSSGHQGFIVLALPAVTEGASIKNP